MLPLRFILVGIGSLIVGSAWLAVRPDLLAGYHYNQYIIALTHLFTLGWISSIIMGATYQLVPVALEAKLYSERLARWHFALHVIGFAGLVLAFRAWDLRLLPYFALVLAAGVGLFIYNIGRTMARVPKWNVVVAGMGASLAWLALTILAGLYLAVAKRWSLGPFEPIARMHAHAHLGVVGFFVMMLVSVSFKLIPMFSLGETRLHPRAGLSLVLLNVGLAGLLVTMPISSPWKLAFALVVLAGLVLYGWQLVAMFRARKRRLDWGLRYFFTAAAFLLPVSLAGIALSWPKLPLTIATARVENIYGYLALVGIVTFAMLGMLYKIVPFLVWYSSYSREIGRSKIPSLADLYSTKLQAGGYWLFITGVLATSAAMAYGDRIAVQAGCAVFLASVLIFAVNIALVLNHLIRPRIEPLPRLRASGETAPRGA